MTSVVGDLNILNSVYPVIKVLCCVNELYVFLVLSHRLSIPANCYIAKIQPKIESGFDQSIVRKLRSFFVFPSTAN